MLQIHGSNSTSWLVDNIDTVTLPSNLCFFLCHPKISQDSRSCGTSARPLWGHRSRFRGPQAPSFTWMLTWSKASLTGRLWWSRFIPRNNNTTCRYKCATPKPQQIDMTHCVEDTPSIHWFSACVGVFKIVKGEGGVCQNARPSPQSSWVLPSMLRRQGAIQSSWKGKGHISRGFPILCQICWSHISTHTHMSLDLSILYMYQSVCNSRF